MYKLKQLSKSTFPGACLNRLRSGFLLVQGEYMKTASRAFFLFLVLCWTSIAESSNQAISKEGDLVKIGNDYIQRTYSVSGKRLSCISVENKRSRSVYSMMNCEPFVIQLSDKSTLKGSEFLIKHALSQTDGDKKILRFDLVYPAKGTVHWAISVLHTVQQGDPVIRKWLEISVAPDDAVIDRIELEKGPSLADREEFTALDMKKRTSLGQPLYNGDLFLGCEFPASNNEIVNQELTVGYYLGRCLSELPYTSYSSIIGAGDNNRDVATRFYEYVDTIARPLKWRLQYNSWMDRDFTGNKNAKNRAVSFAESITYLGKKLKEQDLVVDAYVMDDHWTDWKNGFWKINDKTFPNGFKEAEEACKALGGDFGLWLCPLGGYGGGKIQKPRFVEMGYPEHVFERPKKDGAPPNPMCLAKNKYVADLKDRFLELMRDWNIKSWKLDGFSWSPCYAKDHGHPAGGGPYYYSAFCEDWIDIFDTMRAQDPEVFINITSASWCSPWWLMHANVVWMNNAADAKLSGTGTPRDQTLTYRDGKLYELLIQDRAQFPIEYLYIHEPIKQSKDYYIDEDDSEFHKYMFFSMARGTCFNELYFTPSLLNESQWNSTGQTLRWSRENMQTLRHARMFATGHPEEGHVYGYSAWTDEKAFLAIRNSADHSRDFDLCLDESMGLKSGMGPFTAGYLYPSDKKETLKVSFGDHMRGTLQAHEIRILEFNALPKSAIAQTTSQFTIHQKYGPVTQPAKTKNKTNKPNILLIFYDDLGIGDFGCYGQNKIKTPNVDKIAEEGMIFTRHYSGAVVCAPSRCVLMTGMHTGHSYIRGNKEVGPWRSPWQGQTSIPENTDTLARRLKAAGYKTACIGKWGLGGVKTSGDPLYQGFDFFFGYNDQRHAHNYYPDTIVKNQEYIPIRNPVCGDQIYPDLERISSNYRAFMGKDYTPDMMEAEALKFINDNKQEPFFLYFATTVPHFSLQVPEDSLDEYRGKCDDTPQEGKGYLPHPYPNAALAAMITRSDRSIGRILDLLKRLNLDQNTLVIVTSDNGPAGSIEYFRRTIDISGDLLKGQKTSINEGGIRVPFIAKWPGRIARGTKSDLLSAGWDIYPTICDAAGIDAPKQIDGISMMPTLCGSPARQKEHDYLYWENVTKKNAKRAIRIGDWKLIKVHPQNKLMLYNLKKDPSETNDLFKEQPERAKEMEKMLEKARSANEIFALPTKDAVKKKKKK